MIDRSAVDLDGRFAVVTGAAQGIGEATALALAAFGCDVAICDRNTDGLQSTASAVAALGRRCETGVLDVRDTDAVEAWVSSLGPRVDVLVNNAGGVFVSSFLDLSRNGQRALVDENFTSVTNFVRACVPLMTDGGSIVNVTSVEAFRAAPGFSVYAAMKAGVEQLTKSLALELAPAIRVNTVAPDGIPSPGDAELAAQVGGESGSSYGWKLPLGLGTVDDCAGPIVFLASPLSRYVTGSTIHVDGGSFAASGWRRRSIDEAYEP